MNKDTVTTGSSSLIEDDDFPFEFLSLIAERESWRKEVHRPIYHLHKWWAKRLGSIFRGIILGCLLPKGSDLKEEFYRTHDFSAVSVFDPFMGSGTTVGEAHKLGCIALGRDINPVACESVRVSLGPLDALRLTTAFHQLSANVGERIKNIYRCIDEEGQECDTLYYFWVKQAPCPHCDSQVELFPLYIFARNAYPDRKPQVQIYCPGCGNIFPGLNTDKRVSCPSCELEFNPHKGIIRRITAQCRNCSKDFPIAEAIRSTGDPPHHKLYCKLVLTPKGEKKYVRATKDDEEAYQRCSELLHQEVTRGGIRLPIAVLTEGVNTSQAIGYNYAAWRDFFNDRQLLALGWLHEAIAEIPDTATRDAFLLLYSGVLEFNNLFASYKGEGTGAVRHMFSHHILKPERMPIEANVWGTSKSSGSFSTLFKSRLLRAVTYRSKPVEVSLDDSVDRTNGSLPLSGMVEELWPTTGELKQRGIYLSCGSSDETGLPQESIDLIVTDPPFFDNVHYSELADFFFSWQSLYPRGFIAEAPTTRHTKEVQDADANLFASKLRAVFAECRRALKEDGTLVFTYHHSRSEGWTSLMNAIFDAGFSVINAQPVKSEMSVATPKAQAKEPIQLDVILVCKKKEQDTRIQSDSSVAADEAINRAISKLSRLANAGLKLSLNDKRIVIISQFIAALGPVESSENAIKALLSEQSKLEDAALLPAIPVKPKAKIHQPMGF